MKKKQKIIVTGGLGYIGSHCAVELISSGYDVVLVDDLSNSSKNVLSGLESITNTKIKFEEIDLKDEKLVQNLFLKHNNVSGLIHFAASKAVGESVLNPLLYYQNNLISLINVLNELKNYQKSFNFIFSSSCTVYGQAKNMPISERDPIQKANSPYGNTKQICEEIIEDFCKSNNRIKSISLRYFNPIGAHMSSKIGELPIGKPNNLVPFITQTGIGKQKELSIFGNDYPTPDGTCIRDYIHVVDLAKAHVRAFENIYNSFDKINYDVFNIGTGKGYSVFEVIKAFERVSGIKLNYKICPRRSGDICEAYANTEKANKILKWKAMHSLEEAILSAWEWEKNINNL
tara:strand:- start:1676 stop:2710 length:1035 start_codon:yes stop_codon:yes gene_type:complete